VIHRSKKKAKGPAISVPGTKKEAPPTGRSSFAVRVRRRRKKADAESQTTTRTAGRKTASSKPKRTPTLRSREDRVAIARGRAETNEVTAEPPAAQATPAIATRKHATPAAKRALPPKRNAPASQREPDKGFVAVGRVQAPFGLKGELKVTSLTDNPDRFRPKAKVWAGQQPVTLATVREAGVFVYVTLKVFPDRSSVEKFRHALLQVPESELPELEEGEYYRFQLIGLSVVARDGTLLGVLEEVIETGATDVYRVRTPDGPDLLLAATDDVVLSVDLAAKRMVVDPPAWM
jgi:16S rRNA processing protein RimM